MDRSNSFRSFKGDPERMVKSPSDLSRKRSLVKPERQRLSKDDPNYYYSLATEESNVNVLPSSTGNDPFFAANNSTSMAEDIARDEEGPMLGHGGVVRSESTASRHSWNKYLGRSNSSPGRRDSGGSPASNRKHQAMPSIVSVDPSSVPMPHSPRNVGNEEANRSPQRQSRQSESDHGNYGEPYGEDQVESHGEHNGQHHEHHTLDHIRNFFGHEDGHKREPQAADTGPDLGPIDGDFSDSASARSWIDEKAPVRQRPIMPKDKSFDPWRFYCLALTCFIPNRLLALFGLTTAERQMAWREKIGLISFIILCGAFVGYLTFGFTQTVCLNKDTRIKRKDVLNDELVISGSVYALGSYQHPAVDGIQANSPILYPPVNAGGMDASLMFQNVNGNCKNLIKPKKNSSIPHNDDGEMAWYFPCQLINMNNGSLVNNSGIATQDAYFYDGWGCHSQNSARSDLYGRKVAATIYYSWDDIIGQDAQQLVTYNGDVLNLEYLDYLLTDELEYPELFTTLRHDLSFRGRDISQEMAYGEKRKVMKCLREITKVGVIDTQPIGCLASQVVLYVSLVFIMGLVIVKFLVACYFRFFVARYQGAFPITETEFHTRERRIESWGDDIYSAAPYDRDDLVREPSTAPTNLSATSLSDTPSTPHTMASQFPVGVGAQAVSDGRPRATQDNRSQVGADGRRRSVFDRFTAHDNGRITGVTMSTQNPELSSSKVSGQSLQLEPVYRQSVNGGSRAALERYGAPNEDIAYRGAEPEAVTSPFDRSETPYSVGGETFGSSGAQLAPVGPVGGGSEYLVPQPPLGFRPFGYPLAHVMCMVTAYSESIEGLRTTLDSICTTEYPNSHKLIMIVCDGLIKGSGNDMTTPEICLSMMRDFSEPTEDVQAFSYVSVVAGEKRHNMAKVYAGFYAYDDSTVPPEQQQRVPVICIVKCGTPKEAHASKPGNRGKRDSQVILMSFLQRIMFDERMTELDFEIFNGIRSVTGIAPDYYEMMLMVDADTKVFPDCLTHMCAEMVKDPEIMGLCGETKIANKAQSWVTMIQVFEYFISHHQAKGFESVFGGVSCLPGCFSMYRIKSPKGADGYWVPILCNPDIVERYSDNNISTLHRKNLLLLGEDRYLSTLMAKTFPKRKTIFLPKAACKTIVPDEFKVLLSQRRRWINSTIHNLFELVLVRESCGVFVISMQFVVLVDLISTLVLPAAIAFTLYVVIIAIVRKPTPVLSLVLLAMILGLPGLLIVVTATRASYLVWMGIYLLALPIWNFVLPMYAYWKFDDFSWGNTRAIAGGDKGHEEEHGEFDSSQIVMKRWRDFQNDRARDTFAQGLPSRSETPYY